jgi:hypothetical protein
MSYKENSRVQRVQPRLPQSPTKFSHGIVNIQTSASNIRSNNVHSNRFTSNLSGRFFSNTTLDAATYKRRLEERQEKKKQALSERDRNVQLLEEEVQRVKDELQKRTIERERRQKRIESRKKRFVIYNAAVTIQNNFRKYVAMRELKTRKTVRGVQLRTFAAIMIQRRYRYYYKEYKIKRLNAATKIQAWIRETMHQRQLSLCRKLWGALSMQKLYRGYISRKQCKQSRIKNTANIILLQSLYRKREATKLVIRLKSNHAMCLDVINECINNAVNKTKNTFDCNDDEVEDTVGNGFQLFLTGTIQHTDNDNKPGEETAINDKIPKISFSAFSPKISSTTAPQRTAGIGPSTNTTTASGVVNVIRGLKRLKQQKPNDSSVDLKVNGLLRVAEIEKQRLEKIRQRAKIYERKQQQEELIKKQHEKQMQMKKEKEKEEREKRFNDGMFEMRQKLRKSLEIEKKKNEKMKKEQLKLAKEEEKRKAKQEEKRKLQEKKRREKIRKMAAKKEELKKVLLEEQRLQQIQKFEEEYQYQLEVERKAKEEAYRRRQRLLEVARVKKEEEKLKILQQKERDALKKIEMAESAKRVQEEIKQNLIQKKKEKIAKRKQKEKEAKLKLEKQLRIEEEARRRMEISAANGIREKKMKRRNKYQTKPSSSTGTKMKNKKKRRVRSAGERGNNNNYDLDNNYNDDSHNLGKNNNVSSSKTFSDNGDANTRMDNEYDGEDFGFNKGKDVDLLPKRRKKESMRAYLLRATRVFEKVEKNVGKRNRTEPVLAFVERARKALMSEGVIGVKDNIHHPNNNAINARPPYNHLEADATMLM